MQTLNCTSLRSRLMNGLVLLGMAFISTRGVWCVADVPAKIIQEGDKPSPSIDELLLFFPSKFPKGNWTPRNLHYRDISFDAEDGTHLHGWYCPCDSPRATVLIAHGNGGNVTSRADWLRYLQSRARVSAFIFDYRGYGRSEGVPTVTGVLQDARAARAKLSELANIDESEIILMGESLGGAIVVQLAAESAPQGLILQSTFSSLRDVADVHYPKLSWLVPEAKLNSVATIKAYEGPLLQSHGTADRMIPYESGKSLFQAGNNPKTLVTIKNRDHNNWMTQEYLRSFNSFISNVGKKNR